MGWPEVVVPLAGMLTTLVGTFAGIFAGIWVERVRWEREQRTRFHPDRYAKYTQFIAESNRLVNVSPVEAEKEDKLAEVVAESYAHILMLASPPVAEAAQAYFNACIDLKFAGLAQARASGATPPETLRRELPPLRNAFIEAARKELGIAPAQPEGHRPAAPGPQTGTQRRPWWRRVFGGR